MLIKLFGSWNNFLKEIKEPLLLHYYDKREIINAYENLKQKHKKMTFFFFWKKTRISQRVLEKHFGSWNKFLEIADGIILKRSKWSKEELIKAYKKLGKKLGKVPLPVEIDRNGPPYSQSFCSHFGSYDNFYKSVGDEKPKYKQPYILSKGEAINIFMGLRKKLGRKPTHDEIPHYNSIIKQFGSQKSFIKEVERVEVVLNKKKIKQKIEAVKKKMSGVYEGNLKIKKELDYIPRGNIEQNSLRHLYYITRLKDFGEEIVTKEDVLKECIKSIRKDKPDFKPEILDGFFKGRQPPLK